MTVGHLHQTMGAEGAFELLRELEASGATGLPLEEVLRAMARVGVEDPPALLDDLLAANLLQRSGDRIGLSTFGIRTLLLVEALNGADVREVYRRLSHYDSTLRMYELVREGMTGQFLRSINDRPGFSRLYFCSPWIRLDTRQRQMLVHGVIQEEKQGTIPELFVITRPDPGKEAQAALAVFRGLHATLFFNARLHTKLYIREPGQSGGFPMAIVGSQNLTRSQYLELGIRVNADTVMVDQLIGYFWELCNTSVEE